MRAVTAGRAAGGDEDITAASVPSGLLLKPRKKLWCWRRGSFLVRENAVRKLQIPQMPSMPFLPRLPGFIALPCTTVLFSYAGGLTQRLGHHERLDRQTCSWRIAVGMAPAPAIRTGGQALVPLI